MTTPRIEEMVAFVEVDGVGVALFQSEAGLKLTVSGSNEFIKEIPYDSIVTQAHQAGRDEAVEKIVDKISRNSFLVDGTMMTPTEVILKALKDNK